MYEVMAMHGGAMRLYRTQLADAVSHVSAPYPEETVLPAKRVGADVEAAAHIKALRAHREAAHTFRSLPDRHPDKEAASLVMIETHRRMLETEEALATALGLES